MKLRSTDISDSSWVIWTRLRSCAVCFSRLRLPFTFSRIPSASWTSHRFVAALRAAPIVQAFAGHFVHEYAAGSHGRLEVLEGALLATLVVPSRGALGQEEAAGQLGLSVSVRHGRFRQRVRLTAVGRNKIRQRD